MPDPKFEQSLVLVKPLTKKTQIKPPERVQHKNNRDYFPAELFEKYQNLVTELERVKREHQASIDILDPTNPQVKSLLHQLNELINTSSHCAKDFIALHKKLNLEEISLEFTTQYETLETLFKNQIDLLTQLSNHENPEKKSLAEFHRTLDLFFMTLDTLSAADFNQDNDAMMQKGFQAIREQVKAIISSNLALDKRLIQALEHKVLHRITANEFMTKAKKHLGAEREADKHQPLRAIFNSLETSEQPNRTPAQIKAGIKARNDLLTQLNLSRLKAATQHIALQHQFKTLIDEFKALKPQLDHLHIINPHHAKKTIDEVSNTLAELLDSTEKLDQRYNNANDSSFEDVLIYQEAKLASLPLYQEIMTKTQVTITSLNLDHKESIKAIKESLKKEMERLHDAMNDITIAKIYGRSTTQLDTTEAKHFLKEPFDKIQSSVVQTKKNQIIAHLKEQSNAIEETYISKILDSLRTFKNTFIWPTESSVELNQIYTQLEEALRNERPKSISKFEKRTTTLQNKMNEIRDKINKQTIQNDTTYRATQAFLTAIQNEITRLAEKAPQRLETLTKIQVAFQETQNKYLKNPEDKETYTQELAANIKTLYDLSNSLTNDVKAAPFRRFLLKLIDKTFGALERTFTKSHRHQFFTPVISTATARTVKRALDDLEEGLEPTPKRHKP